MSTVPLATVACPTLADTVDEALAAALAGRRRAVPVVRRSGSHGRERPTSGAATVTVRCRECGSELSGVVPRHLREVRR